MEAVFTGYPDEGKVMLSDAARRRARRVGVLLLLVVGLSIIDLVLTLSYVQSIGMIEANPVAAWIMRNGSPASIIAWKLGSVLMAVTIIYSIRHRRKGELAAWTCAVILILLTMHWLHYQSQLHTLTSLAAAPDSSAVPQWIVLAD